LGHFFEIFLKPLNFFLLCSYRFNSPGPAKRWLREEMPEHTVQDQVPPLTGPNYAKP